MQRGSEADKALVSKYEAVFFLFMAVLVFLSRENPDLVYPQILSLFLALMGLNLATGVSMRRWPRKEWLSAVLIMGNCAAITAILAYSGGTDSNLWVLYLLPIYTVCLLLGAREVALVTAGAIGFNAGFTAFETQAWGSSEAFQLLLKSAIFVVTAAIAFKIVSRDRAARVKLDKSWRQIEELGTLLEAERTHAAQSERMAEVGLVSAGFAHDLNNTFAVILGLSEILASTQDVSSEVKYHLERIAKSATLGRGIIASFMGLAKDSKPPFAPCDLKEIASSVVAVLKEEAAKAGVEVRVDFEDLPPVQGRRTDLQRLFLNLVSNGVRAMKAGGRLDVRGTRAEGPRSGPRRVQVVVEDTGPGIPAEVLERLFKPFATTREKDGGTGLGLFICAEIAAQHMGRLQAENRPGGGARFTLTLPSASKRPARPEPLAFLPGGLVSFGS